MSMKNEPRVDDAKISPIPAYTEKNWWYGWWENPTAFVRPRTMYSGYPEICCFRVADSWEAWCGETEWSRLMRRAGYLGAMCHAYQGVPHLRSIPPCFSLYWYGKDLTAAGCRLKDLRYAVAYLEQQHGLTADRAVA